MTTFPSWPHTLLPHSVSRLFLSTSCKHAGTSVPWCLFQAVVFLNASTALPLGTLPPTVIERVCVSSLWPSVFAEACGGGGREGGRSRNTCWRKELGAHSESSRWPGKSLPGVKKARHCCSLGKTLPGVRKARHCCSLAISSVISKGKLKTEKQNPNLPSLPSVCALEEARVPGEHG